jgi:hypothetical protein
MKATTWKAVFATMNPSPVFETIAEFAELRADHRPTALSEQIDDANDACQRHSLRLLLPAEASRYCQFD